MSASLLHDILTLLGEEAAVAWDIALTDRQLPATTHFAVETDLHVQYDHEFAVRRNGIATKSAGVTSETGFIFAFWTGQSWVLRDDWNVDNLHPGEDWRGYRERIINTICLERLCSST